MVPAEHAIAEEIRDRGDEIHARAELELQVVMRSQLMDARG